MRRIHLTFTLLLLFILFAGCARQQVYLFDEVARDSIHIHDPKKVVYQRAFKTAQRLGFRPLGGLDRESGIYNGVRGDGFFEHSELSFVIEGNILKVEVRSNRNPYKILYEFIQLYNEAHPEKGKKKGLR